MSSENKLPCIFCRWVERKKEYQEIEGKRLLNPNDDGDYLAVLDRDPKVSGHTLIISTKQPQAKDITELFEDETDIFKGVIKWAKRIKKKLNEAFKEEKVKKVYVLSMCDHYSDEELSDYHNEHLHFHLVPRYDFDKDIRGEEVLIRCVPLKSRELKSKELKSKNILSIEETYEILKEG